MNWDARITEGHVQRFRDDIGRIRAVLNDVIVGQEDLVSELVTAVFARGHVLLEGLPGLGKTHLAKALAKSVGVPISRIQCTPDLMPSDITGSEILVEGGASPERRLAFRRGPIFSSMVLVDEINRATPKTQAAFLEAMQEGQVTYAGTTHPLPSPFWVLATQNPIELEGTYPLPEAQLDRFLVKIVVPYPADDALPRIVDRSLDAEPSDHVQTVTPVERVVAMMDEAKEVVIAAPVKAAAAALVLATQPNHGGGSALAHAHFRYGASPRALQALLRTARVHALGEGRAHVSLDDIRANALPVLRHRVLLNIESELDGVDVDSILARISADWSARLRGGG